MVAKLVILPKRANARYVPKLVSVTTPGNWIQHVTKRPLSLPPPHPHHKLKHYENSIAEHKGYAHEKMCICILQHPDLKNVQNVVVGVFDAFFQPNVYDDISNGVNPKMHFRWQVHRK